MAVTAQDRSTAELPGGKGMSRSAKSETATNGTKEPKERIVVLCSKAQRGVIADAARKHGTNTSTWVLAHAVKAAGSNGHAGMTLVLESDVAERLRRAALRLGIDPQDLIEQLLIAEG